MKKSKEAIRKAKTDLENLEKQMNNILDSWNTFSDGKKTTNGKILQSLLRDIEELREYIKK